jgi:alginate O-acetyltransferase complex protein AlgI
MFGLLLMFHFGAFHLLALGWRLYGRSVQPIMNRPLHAASVSDFWSRRWNLAFRDFATHFVLRPLAWRSSPHVGLWGCFVFSGLVHELAISAPARSGYGLPLGYFMLQALGVSIERSAIGSRFGLKQGMNGRLFAFLVIGPPAFFLFHPPFITRVVLPLAGISEATP